MVQLEQATTHDQAVVEEVAAVGVVEIMVALDLKVQISRHCPNPLLAQQEDEDRPSTRYRTTLTVVTTIP